MKKISEMWNGFESERRAAGVKEDECAPKKTQAQKKKNKDCEEQLK